MWLPNRSLLLLPSSERACTPCSQPCQKTTKLARCAFFVDQERHDLFKFVNRQIARITDGQPLSL